MTLLIACRKAPINRFLPVPDLSGNGTGRIDADFTAAGLPVKQNDTV
jgi:hypothetical protein